MPTGIKIYKTVVGWVGTAWTGDGLWALTLPSESMVQAEKKIKEKLPGSLRVEEGEVGEEFYEITTNKKFIFRFAEEINRYFSGEKVTFSVPLDWGLYTPFQRRVLKAVREIPYGSTCTYGAIARRVENPRAARAVGNALGCNRVPLVIPCHRVIKGDGTLGGFTGGLKWKEYLLSLEGILGETAPQSDENVRN